MEIMKFCCLPKGLAPQWNEYILQDGLTTFAFHECATGGYSIKSTTRRQTWQRARNFNFLATKSWLMNNKSANNSGLRRVVNIFLNWPAVYVRILCVRTRCSPSMTPMFFFIFFSIRNAISSTRLSKHPQIHFCYRVASLITK